MDNNKKTQDWKNGKKLSPNVDNDQLGENNGESNCGCGGSKGSNTGKTTSNQNTCR